LAIKTYNYQRDKNIKLSKNFTVGEFYDATNGIVKIDEKLVEFLQKIRSHFNKPVIITSGYRDEKYNEQVGGVYDSLHTKGQACDFYISGIDVLTIAKYAESLDILGIGCYQDDRFVHIDTRISKFFWYNQSNTPTQTFGGKIANYPTKRKGDSGEYIPTLQTKLNQKGFRDANKKPLVVDGIFGNNTEFAVKAFQRANGIVIDGIVGPETWGKLA